MKNIYRSALILALAFTACQEEIQQPFSSICDDEMGFNLIVPGAKTRVSESGFEASDKIGLFVTDWVDDKTPMPLQISGNRANNLSLTFDGTQWSPEKKVYWGEGKSDVYAYYPYFEDLTDVNSQPFSVSEDQSTKAAYDASDFLWAVANGVSREDGSVNLAMKHIMSKLTVRIVAGEDYVGSLPEDASVLLHSTVPCAMVDLESGAVVKDPYSGSKSIKMQNLGIRNYDGTEAVVYRAIVVPQMLENSVPLLEINSKSVSYLLEDMFNFRPGISYIYTVTLNTSTTAIKVEIGCELEDWNSTGDNEEEGGEGGSEGGGPGEEDGVERINLSAEGTANSYIISEAGDYKFKAVQGNLDATVGNVKTVEVLWETFGTDVCPQVGELISSVSYSNGYVRFSTPETFREGNALIAVKNSAGVILWSWHIWMTDEPQIHVYDNKAGMMMDRNLGATSSSAGEVESLGLLYQWGRKDPFLGSASVSENIDAASTGNWDIQDYPSRDDMSPVHVVESNPTVFYRQTASGRWKKDKTVYDPCPVGWRVPQGDEAGVWGKADFVRMPFDEDNLGMWFNASYPDHVWYPAAGCRYWEDGKLRRVGSNGFYAAFSPDFWHMAASFARDYFSSNTNNWWVNDFHQSESNAYAVRCYRDYDEDLLPDVAVPELETSAAVDLSESGTSNSYIVSSAGVYSFPAVKGNSSKSVGAAAYANLVWESFGTDVKPVRYDLIPAVKYENGKVYFKTADSFREGNALIAVKDEEGKILWSWHIWMTDQPKEQVYYNDAGIMMDRNLGATSAVPGDPDVLGLKYQWGRKDPFMGDLTTDLYKSSESTYIWPCERTYDDGDNPIAFSISHPTTVLSGRNYGDWIQSETTRLDNTRWQSTKTIYDPCPAGWRVPDGGENGIWAKAIAHHGNWCNSSMNFSGIYGDDEVIYYPVIGCSLDQNRDSYLWTCTPHKYPNENTGINAVCFSYWGNGNFRDHYGSRAGRNYVRCQKEEAEN